MPEKTNIEKIHRVQLSDLPKDHKTRWIAKRKAILVRAVQEGLISMDEACRRYRLTQEEFHSWEFHMAKQGVAGLRAMRLRSAAKRARDKARRSQSP